MDYEYKVTTHYLDGYFSGYRVAINAGSKGEFIFIYFILQ